VTPSTNSCALNSLDPRNRPPDAAERIVGQQAEALAEGDGRDQHESECGVEEGRSPRQQDRGDDDVEHEEEHERVLEPSPEVEEQGEGDQVDADLHAGKYRRPHRLALAFETQQSARCQKPGHPAAAARLRRGRLGAELPMKERERRVVDR
jgi:hypothetical protein